VSGNKRKPAALAKFGVVVGTVVIASIAMPTVAANAVLQTFDALTCTVDATTRSAPSGAVPGQSTVSVSATPGTCVSLALVFPSFTSVSNTLTVNCATGVGSGELAVTWTGGGTDTGSVELASSAATLLAGTMDSGRFDGEPVTLTLDTSQPFLKQFCSSTTASSPLSTHGVLTIGEPAQPIADDANAAADSCQYDPSDVCDQTLESVTSPAKSATNTAATQLAENAPAVSNAIGTGVSTVLGAGQQVDSDTSALDNAFAEQPLLTDADSTANTVTGTPDEAGYYYRPHPSDSGTAPCDTGWSPEFDSNGNYEYFLTDYTSPRYEYGSNAYTSYWHHYEVESGVYVFRWSHCKYLRSKSYLIMIRDQTCTGNGQGCSYGGSKWTSDKESGRHWKDTVGHCVAFYEDTDRGIYQRTPSFCG
jgi:hypothetical protein